MGVNSGKVHMAQPVERIASPNHTLMAKQPDMLYLVFATAESGPGDEPLDVTQGAGGTDVMGLHGASINLTVEYVPTVRTGYLSLFHLHAVHASVAGVPEPLGYGYLFEDS
jgi:hypothetical protein